jgi:ribosomal protein L32E
MSTHVGTCDHPGQIVSGTLGIEQRRRKSHTKKEWLEHHSNRIFSLWLGWRTPLGISSQYLERVKQELSEYYKEPLKRKFIEATYH